MSFVEFLTVAVLLWLVTSYVVFRIGQRVSMTLSLDHFSAGWWSALILVVIWHTLIKAVVWAGLLPT